MLVSSFFVIDLVLDITCKMLDIMFVNSLYVFEGT